MQEITVHAEIHLPIPSTHHATCHVFNSMFIATQYHRMKLRLPDNLYKCQNEQVAKEFRRKAASQGRIFYGGQRDVTLTSLEHCSRMPQSRQLP